MKEEDPVDIVVFDYIPAVSYALYQNHVPVIRQLSVKNNSDKEWPSLIIHIIPSDDFAEPLQINADQVLPGEVFKPEIIQLKLKPAFINSLTEKMISSLRLVIHTGEEEIHSREYEIDLLAYDQWLGSAILPEMLSAFVMPNLPELTPILKTAASILAKWTDNSALNAYQSQNPDRVKKQMAALYAAIAELKIIYCTVPASFGGVGQRVRLVDTVLEIRMGNCIEMSLLYASCLEAIGLHPILILIKGHAFVGAWLIDDTFPDAVNDDPSLLTKRMASGINEILLIEATAMNEGHNPSFDEAIQLAANHFANLTEFEYFIDVSRSRFSGIRPLPLRRKNGQDWEIIDTQIEHSGKERLDSQNPESLEGAVKLNHVQQISFGKQQLWERKLLDLSLRNNLLNLRITKSSLQFIPVSLNELEDAMAGGKEFQILCKPKDWDNPLRSSGIYQSLNSQDPMSQLVQQELKQNRLRVYLSEEELNAGLIGLYRSARQAMEENGANTLYLAIGLLRWYETSSSERPRFAPILLMPVELIRKSVKKGFIIHSREEDTVLNITLLEKLRQDYSLSLSGLDPLPKDESGVDVKLIFNVIRKTIMSIPRWDVEEQIFLGTFSFNKFIMWNDIHSNAEKMKENSIVSGLMVGHLKAPFPFNQEENLDEKYGPADIMLPINADSSQLQAINAASEGNSFILHGPPGTGKSQTITNIIANALYKGKRVLFVAEKMAALSVVQSRLEAIGIGPFCLELHSNKATKSEVLAQLQRTSDVVQQKTPENFRMEAERLNQLRKVLNQYVFSLHQKQQCGYSLYDLFNEYVQYPDVNDHIPFPPGILKELGKEKLVQWMDTVEELQVAAMLCGDASSKHPLYGIELNQYSNQIKEEIAKALAVFIETRKALNKTHAETTVLLQFSDTSWNEEKLRKFNILIERILHLHEMPKAFFRIEQLSALSEELLPLVSAGEQQNILKNALLQQFQPSLLTAPANKFLAEWNKANAKWFLPRYFSQKTIKRNLYGYLKSGSIAKEQIPEILLSILDFQEKNTIIEEHSSYLKEMLDHMWKNGQPNWENVRKALMAVEELDLFLLQWCGNSISAYTMRSRIGYLFRNGRQYFMENEGQLLRTFGGRIENEQKARQDLERLLTVKLPFVLNKDTDDWLSKASLWKEHLNELKDWFNWTQIRQKAVLQDLQLFIQAYEKGNVDTNSLLNSFKKGLFRSLAELIIERDPQLSAFNGRYFEAQIQKYRELIESFTLLTRSALYAELASHVPIFSQGAAATSETGILQKAIKSGGRGVSIRQLFNAIPNLLPRLCPCMLMSPISVAQYLDINNAPYDLIIFDEASQMPTSEAVGAIARGKNLIVVGDPKQMPPTSFFSSIHFDEEDSNEDLESILDDCQALSIPSRQLRWHYRSQHESLIAFSNAKYYDNSLFTFPSPDDLATRVHFVPVDGVYDRGKTRQNRAEAEAIVREIVKLLSLPEKERKSIGVVTFSSVQQVLIEDLLNEEFIKNPALEETNNKSPEPLFIKNLENVQGDERDIILFSICYGPDETGYISLNFGPLNREGGWRRLNVAVSRARYLMKIYSTIHADQIDLSRSRSEGVSGLKAFLAFAEKGKSALPIRPSASMVKRTFKALEASVAASLKELGYDVDINVGCSEYRIDMAIVHDEKPTEYLLGILFDGYNYYASQSARDRNVIQSSVLSVLGWKIFRVWALDWWENKDKVMQDLLEFIEQTKSLIHSHTIIPEIPEEPESIMSRSAAEEEKTQASSAGKVTVYNSAPVFQQPQTTELIQPNIKQDIDYPIYEITALPILTNVSFEDFLAYSSTETLTQQISWVIETEAPINRSLLCRRVLASWGVSRLGSRIQVRFERVFSAMKLNTTRDQEYNTCFWKEGQNPDQYSVFRLAAREEERRNAEDLPSAEIANGVCEILSNQISLPEDDLIREAAKLFQYGRVGGNVESAMRRGIQEAIHRQRVKKENGRIVFVN